MTEARPRIQPRTLRPQLTLREALSDPALLGNVLAGASWKPWRTLLIASMGEALTDDERAIFQLLTGRAREPGQRIEEGVFVVGRRGGKSRAIGVLATYIAGLCQHPTLVPGETGVVLCIAPDLEQANICFNYIESNFTQSPILSQLVASKTARTIRLTNSIEISVKASDFRRLRGPTYVAIVADECAFWLSDGSSNPDTEILASCRPGLSTTGGSMFLISSPYARRGELWRLYQTYYGTDGDPLILVAQADTRTMNASLSESVIRRAYARDPISAAAEYGAQFRNDMESYVSREAVMACVVAGRYEQYPKGGISYVAFADPSGGAADSFTICIAHYDASRSMVVIDAIRETKPPFSPEMVCVEYSALIKKYGLTQLTGDRYGGEWPRQEFARHGVNYEPNARPKSMLYIDALALLNSCRVELLDHPRTINQLLNLERRTGSQRDVVDHPVGGRDDCINAVCGAMLAAVSRFGTYSLEGFQPEFVDHDSGEDNIVSREAQRRKSVANDLYGALSAMIAEAHTPNFGRWR